MEKQGQYGIRNPLFMYQGTAGYSVTAALLEGDGEQEAAAPYLVTSSESGTRRCGAL